jgi:Family of unknown function (DUF6460)
MVGRALGFLLLCLVVGLLLTWLHITPQGLFTDAFATATHIVHLVIEVARWAMPYILLGAVVVVPIALLGFLLRARRR